LPVINGSGSTILEKFSFDLKLHFHVLFNYFFSLEPTSRDKDSDICTSVADPDPFDTDPDPSFHFDTDLDPVFPYDTVPAV
jgi:hypothetical protein